MYIDSREIGRQTGPKARRFDGKVSFEINERNKKKTMNTKNFRAK